MESSSSSRYRASPSHGRLHRVPPRQRLSRRRSGDAASLAHSATVARAYDALAPYAGTLEGRQEWMREVLWRHYDRLFAAGGRVLDVGCGIGHDTLHLARRGVFVTAIDLAPQMIAGLTSQLIETSFGVDDLTPRVRAQHADAAELATWPGAYFHGVISSFGALNTVNDLAGFAADTARLLLPGGRLVAHLLAPGDLWQRRRYSLLKGRVAARQFFSARRRDVTISGESVRHRMASWSLAYRRYFRPHFRLRAAYALGFLLPEHRAERLRSVAARALGRLERRLGALPPFLDFSRFYVLDLEPRPEIVDEPRHEL